MITQNDQALMLGFHSDWRYGKSSPVIQNKGF